MEIKNWHIRTALSMIVFSVVMMAAVWHIGAVWQAIGVALGMVSFLIVGLCVAFILNTPLRFLESRLLLPLERRFCGERASWHRPAALALTLLFFAGVVFAAVFMVIPELVRTFVVLGEQIPPFFDEVNLWIAGLAEESGRSLDAMNLPQLDWVKIGDAMLDWLRNGAGNLLTGTMSVASSFASGIFSFVVGFVLAIYVLYQKERLGSQARRVLSAYLPERRVNRLMEIGGLANLIFGNFISGQFLEAVILGALCFAGMTILGFPFAPMVSILICVTAFIPVFGAFIGLVVGAFMILVNQGAAQALWFCLFLFGLQQVENNLIYPHVVGKRVMLPGLWVLVAVTLGGNIAGVAGMLLGVPFVSLLYALFRQAVNARNAAREGAGEDK